MKHALEIGCIVGGLVAILIAALQIAIRLRVIPGSAPVNAAMDGEDQIYATLFLANGTLLIWCGRVIHFRAGVVHALLAARQPAGLVPG